MRRPIETLATGLGHPEGPDILPDGRVVMVETYGSRILAWSAERGIHLEICPSSNLDTKVVRDLDELREFIAVFRKHKVHFSFNTDGPEMLKTYIRDELAQLGRLAILSLDDQRAAAETSLAASFVPNVSDVPPPGREPARREVVEREEA